MRQRLIVIGFDGATFDLIGPWVREGNLPTFSNLLGEGAYGELESTLPPMSAPAWTSFATGKNPGKHGIFGFTRKMRGDYDLELVTGGQVRARTFWEVMGTHGLKVIIMNVPMTFPPKPVNGILVSGLDAPGTGCQFTYPPEIREEILRAVPRYQISMHLGGTLDTQEKRVRALEEILISIEARSQVAHLLARKYPWDVLVVKFNNPDLAHHHFWRFMDKNHPQYNPEESKGLGDAILRVYRKLDRVLAGFEALCGEDTSLIVVSDHGGGPRFPKAIYLNEWLRSERLLTPLNHTVGTLEKRLLNALLRFLLKRLSPSQKDFIRKLSPRTISRVVSHVKFTGIDWSKTKAYVGELPSIRLNVAGRERHGTVTPEEYELLRTRIIEGLRDLKDAKTGEALIERAVRREEVYTGSCVENAPDIIVVPKDHLYAVSWKLSSGQLESYLVDEPHWRGTSGRHKPNGILIARGKAFHRNQEISGAKIIDIGPTLLYLAGVPIPRDVDGKLVRHLFTREFLDSHPVDFQEGDGGLPEGEGQEAYSPEEARRIREMLEGLGYIE